jgi:ubiquinone/menaquinone biosynthesis C-methylase UbiE
VILEIGSGTGRVTLPLAAHAAQIVATDSSINLVMKLREKSRKQNVTNLDLLVCDSHQLPFRGETFDSAVGARVFWHIADVSQSIAQVLSVLKQNGPVIFDFPNSSGAFRVLSTALKSQDVFTLFLTSSSLHRILGSPKYSITIEGQVSPILYLWPESIFPRRQALRNLLFALERLGRTRVFSWMFTYLMVNLRAE